MRPVKVLTTDGWKWVNPDAISVMWPLDGSTTRVHTAAGFMDFKGTPDDVAASLWGAMPAPPKAEVRRGR